MINVNATGRLTKSPELRVTSTGKSVANFTLACKRKRPDKDGNVPTAFIKCTLWGKGAEAFAKYTLKGSLMAVSGELQTRSYDDQQGLTHYVTELLVEGFEFLESKATVQQRETALTSPNASTTPPTPDPSQYERVAQDDPYTQPSLDGLSTYGFND